MKKKFGPPPDTKQAFAKQQPEFNSRMNRRFRIASQIVKKAIRFRIPGFFLDRKANPEPEHRMRSEFVGSRRMTGSFSPSGCVDDLH